MHLLERRGDEVNLDDVIESLLNEFEDYLEHPYHRELLYKRQLINIENKLDSLIERNGVNRCRFSNESSDSVMKLITGVGLDERNKAISHLSEKLMGTNTLTICDPYFIKGTKMMPPENLANEFVNLLPRTLKVLELYVKPRVREKLFAESLNSALKNREIKLIVRKTDDVHDRVWIKDYDEAFVVGTSFNGIGNKCAFILDLPSEDRKQFIFSLSELSRKLSKSKSA
jgi:hypothetical protein